MYSFAQYIKKKINNVSLEWEVVIHLQFPLCGQSWVRRSEWLFLLRRLCCMTGGRIGVFADNFNRLLLEKGWKNTRDNHCHVFKEGINVSNIFNTLYIGGGRSALCDLHWSLVSVAWDTKGKKGLSLATLSPVSGDTSLLGAMVFLLFGVCHSASSSFFNLFSWKLPSSSFFCGLYNSHRQLSAQL